MRLKNKKTGEIGYTAVLQSKAIVVMDENAIQLARYTTLAGLNEEWEDAPKEPKEFYFIDQFMSVSKGVVDDVEYAGRHKAVNYAKKTSNNLKTAGNYFETKEEAEKALEKLKAFKRLKDNGMRKYSFHKEKTGIDLDFYTLTILAPRDKDSLDLLFGGEE